MRVLMPYAGAQAANMSTGLIVLAKMVFPKATPLQQVVLILEPGIDTLQL